MRLSFVGLVALLGAGCQDYVALEKDFCDTAKIEGGMVSLCDDFESSAIDTSKWTTNIMGGGALVTEHYDGGKPAHGSMTADPGYAYRGRWALHASLPAAVDAEAQLVESKVTAASPQLSVRFFSYLSSAGGKVDLVRLLDGNGMTQRTLAFNDGVIVASDIASGGSTSITPIFGSSGWHCIEADFYPNEIDLSLDFAASAEQDASVTGLPPVTFATTQFGAARAADANSQSADLWLDEVILDHRFIGCGP